MRVCVDLDELAVRRLVVMQLQVSNSRLQGKKAEAGASQVEDPHNLPTVITLQVVRVHLSAENRQQEGGLSNLRFIFWYT